MRRHGNPLRTDIRGAEPHRLCVVKRILMLHNFLACQLVVHAAC
jgi:hypothetical protein